MMLDNERALVAKRLGFDDIFDVISESGAAVDVGASALRLGRTKESELHGHAPRLVPRYTKDPNQ